jgi:hypothetical protein
MTANNPDEGYPQTFILPVIEAVQSGDVVIGRREFLVAVGALGAAAGIGMLTGCTPSSEQHMPPPTNAPASPEHAPTPEQKTEALTSSFTVVAQCSGSLGTWQ